jgi:uncharacterized protein (DUF58 family)
MNGADRQSLLEGERAGLRYALALPRSVTAAMAGLHLGRQAGASLEFREHRDYQPGDDPRRIDWNAYARSDKLQIKLHREEINPHLDLVLDASRSMSLEASAKRRAALGLAAVFAVAAENAAFSHQLWLARDRCIPVANGAHRPSTWPALELDHDGHTADALTRGPAAFRRQGMRALLSDLLWLDEPLSVLRRLAQGAAAVVVVQVLADADRNPPERGRVRLVDSETGEQCELFLDDEAIRRYRDALARHQQNWQRACRQAGATMVSLVAEEVVADWNLDALVQAEVLKI